MGEPGGLPSMGFHRVGHDRSDLAAAAAAAGINSTSNGVSTEQELVCGVGRTRILFNFTLDESLLYYILNILTAALQSHRRPETLFRAKLFSKLRDILGLN